MKNRVSIFDWYLYKTGYDTMIPFIIKIIMILGSILLFFSLLGVSYKLALLSLFVLVPIIISSIIIGEKYFNSRIMEEYQHLNKSYKYKGKYYSAWYIILNSKDPYFKELMDIMGNDGTLSEDRNILYNLDGLYMPPFKKGVIESHERKYKNHWKNNIESNRLLTYIEFLRYKENKLKIEKSNEMIKEIKEFQDYYNLNNKGENKNEH
ncbi:hypothetical protein PALS2_116 [Staphylococcus phage PALS_2]|nr:hypothetical protein PALS2_116 [Staphylococcus phage PALS_2]